MKYCIINNKNIIENIIESEENFATKIGALSFYFDAEIGNFYNPPFDFRQYYIGTNTDIISIYYQSPPKAIIICYNDKSYIFFFNIKQYENVKLKWERNKVQISSEELNQLNKTYYYLLIT